MIRKLASDHVQPLVKTIFSANEVLRAFEKVDEIGEALEAPLEQKRLDVKNLESEKVKNGKKKRKGVFSNKGNKSLPLPPELTVTAKKRIVPLKLLVKDLTR